MSELLPARRLSPTALPAIVSEAGPQAAFAHDEFFSIDNAHTLRAYQGAIARFLAFLEASGLPLQGVRPGHVSEYLKQLKAEGLSDPSRKVHLAAIRK